MSGFFRTFSFRILTVSVLFGVSIEPLWPQLWNQQLPATSEVFRYMVLGEWFHRAWSLNVLYPRWFLEMNGGYGYPEFVFYQPGYFFVHSLIAFGVDDWLGRQLITLTLIAFLGGIGMYRLARLWVPPLEALWLVAVFIMAPYSRINLFTRGDLSEWMCLILLPWSLWALLVFLKQRSQSLDGVALSWFTLSIITALLFYCHPVAVIFLPGVLFFLALGGSPYPWLSPMGRRAILEMIAAVMMGLLLSAPYWASVVVMKPFVLSEASYSDWSKAFDNASPFWTLLFGSFWKPKTFHETEFLGAPFFLLTLVGCWLGRKSALIRMTGFLYLLMLFLMIPIGRLFWHLHPFSLLQFPWRLCLFAPLLPAIAARGILLLVVPKALRYGLMASCLLGLGFWNAHDANQFKAWEDLGPLDQKDYACFLDFTRIAKPGTYLSTLDTGEWLPKTSQPAQGLAPRQTADRVLGCEGLAEKAGAIVERIFHVDAFPVVLEKPLVEVVDASWMVLPVKESSPSGRVEALLEGGKATEVIINQLYLPGWKVSLNDQAWPENVLLNQRMADGRIRFSLPAGRWRLKASYEGPLYSDTLQIFMGLGLILGIFYWRNDGLKRAAIG